MTKSSITAEPGQHSIVATRVLDAPRELVFKLMTDPAAIPQWWGPSRFTTTVDKMEVRAGGEWRYVQHNAEGNEFAFRGVYHSVDAPERTIATFEWEGMPGHVALDTMTLEDVDGKTRVTSITVFQTVADRDGMFQSGYVEGENSSMDRLTELLAQAQAGK